MDGWWIKEKAESQTDRREWEMTNVRTGTLNVSYSKQ